MNETRIEISKLSPGESLIFRLLIWQYAIKVKKSIPSKCVLLFDEPDSHLHPSAVKNLLDNLKDLCDLGVQIFFTTHNPTTVSFIKKENLFLMEKQGDKLSIRKGGRTEIFHKLTSRLVNIEAPSRKIFIEGKDSPFYKLIYKLLINLNLVSDHFNLNFMPLPAGGEFGRRNKSTIINFMKNIEPDDDSEYDTIHSYYGIIDDDNDRLVTCEENSRKKNSNIKNLLVLKRYSHENYILDPVNIYFYFRSLKDNTKNENVQKLLNGVEEKVKNITKFTQAVSEILLNFKIINIYEEILKPTEVAVEEIKNFLQIIVDEVGKNVFDIIFKPNSKYDTLSSITTPILLKWILNMSKPDLDYIKDESSEDDGFIKGTGKKKEILIKGHEALKKFLVFWRFYYEL